jgi:hypothetical protein
MDQNAAVINQTAPSVNYDRQRDLVNNAAIKKLARRGGAKRIDGGVYDYVRGMAEKALHNFINSAAALREGMKEPTLEEIRGTELKDGTHVQYRVLNTSQIVQGMARHGLEVFGLEVCRKISRRQRAGGDRERLEEIREQDIRRMMNLPKKPRTREQAEAYVREKEEMRARARERARARAAGAPPLGRAARAAQSRRNLEEARRTLEQKKANRRTLALERQRQGKLKWDELKQPRRQSFAVYKTPKQAERQREEREEVNRPGSYWAEGVRDLL